MISGKKIRKNLFNKIILGAMLIMENQAKWNMFVLTISMKKRCKKFWL